MNGNEVDQKFAIVCQGFALYIEIWGMGVLGAGVHSVGWTKGNVICVVVAACSLLESGTPGIPRLFGVMIHGTPGSSISFVDRSESSILKYD